MLSDKLLCLVTGNLTELSECEYGLCLVNVLCPSHKGVLPLDENGVLEGPCVYCCIISMKEGDT